MLYFICKSRSQSLEEERRDTESMFLKSSVKFPQSVMIWAAVSSAGVGPLCFLKSTVSADIYQDMLEHVMLPSADKLYGDTDFIFQQDLAPAHTAKGTKSWFNDHVLLCLIDQQTRLTWTMVVGNQEEDERHQTQQYRWPECWYKSNLCFITPEQCHRLIVSMPRRIDAVTHAKGAPTKYWVHRNEHDISV